MIRLSNNKGLSLIELVVTMAILSVLASLILPSAQMIAKRNKEIELRRSLRTMRTAIDDYYKANYDAMYVSKTKPIVINSENSSGYPESLQKLVEGDDFGKVDGMKKKFLRRIPIDPFNPPKPGEEPKWGVRGYADEPDSPPSDDTKPKGGVFDVYSLSEETAIDGTKYKDW